MNEYNPDIHHRRSIRLHKYDYSREGLYFITICTLNRECLFGKIVDGKMILNEYGEIVEMVWWNLLNHYSNVELLEFVVMPNHIHGIIAITGVVTVGADVVRADVVRAGFKPAPTGHGLSEIVRAFKTFSARKINEMRELAGISVWQRNYYENIIRNDKSYQTIAEYIINNPANWEIDKFCRGEWHSPNNIHQNKKEGDKNE
ncbi:MAG: hypothetical protein LBO74_10605 [Candidatus Symbiothrix sp.]|jgi:REP element-mobilizing transposase RayT|nr:hypothetical protein [Candidatus Symbiothrix sp.]